MQIRYGSGRIAEGVMLRLTDTMARVAILGEDDVAEFRLMSGHWISEDWDCVSFEFVNAPVLQVLFVSEANAAAGAMPSYVN